MDLHHHRRHTTIPQVPTRRHQDPGERIVATHLPADSFEGRLEGARQRLRCMEVIGADAEIRPPAGRRRLVGQGRSGEAVAVDHEAAPVFLQCCIHQGFQGTVVRHVVVAQQRRSVVRLKRAPQRDAGRGLRVDDAEPVPRCRLQVVVHEPFHVDHEATHRCARTANAAVRRDEQGGRVVVRPPLDLSSQLLVAHDELVPH